MVFLLKLLKNKKHNQILIKLLIIGNVLGALYGFIFYYGKELLQSPIQLIPFIPDCPLYTLLFAISIYLIQKNKKVSKLYFLTLTGALKYSTWTIFVLLAFPNFYFTQTQTIQYTILFVAHAILFLESLLLINKSKTTTKYALIVLVWLLINDIIDYTYSTHPPIPVESIQTIAIVTIVITLITWSIAKILTKKN